MIGHHRTLLGKLGHPPKTGVFRIFYLFPYIYMSDCTTGHFRCPMASPDTQAIGETVLRRKLAVWWGARNRRLCQDARPDNSTVLPLA